mmetsp:Transcript_66852/g.183370  ORF Transcript_66852/g.183370 Transcript_66852/m.183370 type:complete len:82 (-) Transcript_66852:344-589(-)
MRSRAAKLGPSQEEMLQPPCGAQGGPPAVRQTSMALHHRIGLQSYPISTQQTLEAPREDPSLSQRQLMVSVSTAVSFVSPP